MPPEQPYRWVPARNLLLWLYWAYLPYRVLLLRF